jgi:hypothetical protein
MEQHELSTPAAEIIRNWALPSRPLRLERHYVGLEQ